MSNNIIVLDERYIDKIDAVINESIFYAFKDIIPKKYFKYPIVSCDEIRCMIRKCKFYGYVVDDNVVGVAALCPENDIGWVRCVYVLPSYQRRGIGSKLINKIIEDAKRLGLKKLRLVTPEKAYWTINFYTKHGFKIVDRIKRPCWYDVLMEKSL